MIFGNVDINTGLRWDLWTWQEFTAFYNYALAGKITDSQLHIAKVLGVPIPEKKPKKKGSNIPFLP